MSEKQLISWSVFTLLPVLFLMRFYYGYLKHNHFGKKKISIFKIAQGENISNRKLVNFSRFVIGFSILAYAIISFAIMNFKRINS